MLVRRNDWAGFVIETPARAIIKVVFLIDGVDILRRLVRKEEPGRVVFSGIPVGYIRPNVVLMALTEYKELNLTYNEMVYTKITPGFPDRPTVQQLRFDYTVKSKTTPKYCIFDIPESIVQFLGKRRFVIYELTEEGDHLVSDPYMMPEETVHVISKSAKIQRLYATEKIKVYIPSELYSQDLSTMKVRAR